jgi:hypothetical protein
VAVSTLSQPDLPELESEGAEGHGKLLLVLQVELGGGRTGAIEVREGHSLRELALDFCVAHALDPARVADSLERHLQRKMAELLALEEERERTAVAGLEAERERAATAGASR